MSDQDFSQPTIDVSTAEKFTSTITPLNSGAANFVQAHWGPAPTMSYSNRWALQTALARYRPQMTEEEGDAAAQTIMRYQVQWE
ncbi:hypothetical protein IAT38_004707 [Cryptococcus sp. DSM 104549]